MPSKNAHIARDLVENPDKYDEFRHEFTSEREYYRRVRNDAPQTLETFDEFRRLHEIFLEKSRGDAIQEWVEENLARSLKNMVLGTSPRGQAYPLSTLSDIQTRIEEYSSLGLDTPSLSMVVDTIIEALFASEDAKLRQGAHETLSELLTEKPSFEQFGGPADQLARVKVAQSLAADRFAGPETSPADELEMAAREYHAATDCPSAPDGADACLAAARGITPGTSDKRRLLAAAVHQDPTSIEAFWELLYWGARATIERFRHINEQPTLGRLESARLQLSVVDSYTDTVDKPEAWKSRIEAYRHVADGITCSQGRYTTTRENWPAVDFEGASQAYKAAAETIKPIDRSRHLKYQSKAYRYQAYAADDPALAYQVHGDAIDWLLSTHNTEEAIDPTLIQDLIRQHHFRRLEYEIKHSFSARDFEDVVRQYIDYHTHRENVPITTKSNSVVDACYHLAKSVISWRRGENENTLYHSQRATDIAASNDNISVDRLATHAFTPQLVRNWRAAVTIDALGSQ